MSTDPHRYPALHMTHTYLSHQLEEEDANAEWREQLDAAAARAANEDITENRDEPAETDEF